jgi:hypothetical protein
MRRIQNLFLLLIIIGPLHMGEQLLTSIEEYHAIRRGLAQYYAMFDPAAADSVSVILITVVWTVVSLLIYAVLREGLPRLFVMGLLGVFAVAEVHHVIQAFAEVRYDPGVVTCVPYAALGAMMLDAVWREFKRARGAYVAQEHPLATGV